MDITGDAIISVFAVDHKVVLRPRFAAIRRVGAGLGSPLFAGTAALSKEARVQSRCL